MRRSAPRCCAWSASPKGRRCRQRSASQLSALEDDQKKRATRSLRDGIDRVLTDLQSMFRDVIMLQFGRDDELINRELRERTERARISLAARPVLLSYLTTLPIPGSRWSATSHRCSPWRACS